MLKGKPANNRNKFVLKKAKDEVMPYPDISLTSGTRSIRRIRKLSEESHPFPCTIFHQNMDDHGFPQLHL